MKVVKAYPGCWARVNSRQFNIYPQGLRLTADIDSNAWLVLCRGLSFHIRPGESWTTCTCAHSPLRTLLKA
jgi:hypothetical protein